MQAERDAERCEVTKTKTAWSKGTFKVAVNPRRANPYPDNGERTGYVRGPFGICHVWDRWWVITHLPSGMKVSDNPGSLADAKRRVDALLPLANWEQTDPLRTVAEERRKAIKQIAMGRRQDANPIP